MMFWTLALFLPFGRSRAEEDPQFIEENMYINEELKNTEPIDFRCSMISFGQFSFASKVYLRMYYNIEPQEEIGCKYQSADGNEHRYYPTPTGLDPMMKFYIDKIHEGIAAIAASPKIPLDEPSTIKRRKIYCMDMRMMGSTFLEYLETFHSDDETCWKIKEIAKECGIFRHMWFYWVRSLYNRLCLDEDGCYNVMELYEDDMPYCVKYIANRQFKNSSFGSWHHSIINYCQLTDVAPGANDTRYDETILFEDGKTEDELMAMCQFLRLAAVSGRPTELKFQRALRFRLLPDEGKEEEIREIKLEERDIEDTDAGRNSAAIAIYPGRTAYVIIIMLIYGICS